MRKALFRRSGLGFETALMFQRTTSVNTGTTRRVFQLTCIETKAERSA